MAHVKYWGSLVYSNPLIHTPPKKINMIYMTNIMNTITEWHKINALAHLYHVVMVKMRVNAK